MYYKYYYQTVGAAVHIVGFAISESDWEPK